MLIWTWAHTCTRLYTDVTQISGNIPKETYPVQTHSNTEHQVRGVFAAALHVGSQAVQVFPATQTQHRLTPKHTPQHFQRKHIDVVIRCNKEPLKSAAETQANPTVTVPDLSGSPKHYLKLYMFMHTLVLNQCVVGSHTSISPNTFCD